MSCMLRTGIIQIVPVQRGPFQSSRVLCKCDLDLRMILLREARSDGLMRRFGSVGFGGWTYFFVYDNITGLHSHRDYSTVIVLFCDWYDA